MDARTVPYEDYIATYKAWVQSQEELEYQRALYIRDTQFLERNIARLEKKAADSEARMTAACRVYYRLSKRYTALRKQVQAA